MVYKFLNGKRDITTVPLCDANGVGKFLIDILNMKTIGGMEILVPQLIIFPFQQVNIKNQKSDSIHGFICIPRIDMEKYEIICASIVSHDNVCTGD